MRNLLFLLVFLGVAGLLLKFGAVTAQAEDTQEHGGDIIYTKPVKAVIFSHKAHTEDLGLQCGWCHDKVFEMEALHMQKEADFDMNSLCNERYCGTCHNGDIAFSTTTQCARCHIGIKGYNELVQQGKIKPEPSEKVVKKE